MSKLNIPNKSTVFLQLIMHSIRIHQTIATTALQTFTMYIVGADA